MRLTTVFNAYQLAEVYKQSCKRQREKGSLGIAVDNDEIALRWQRYNRQSRRFENRVVDALEQIDNKQ